MGEHHVEQNARNKTESKRKTATLLLKSLLKLEPMEGKKKKKRAEVIHTAAVPLSCQPLLQRPFQHAVHVAATVMYRGHWQIFFITLRIYCWGPSSFTPYATQPSTLSQFKVLLWQWYSRWGLGGGWGGGFCWVWTPIQTLSVEHFLHSELEPFLQVFCTAWSPR